MTIERRTLEQPSQLDRVVRALHDLFRPFNDRRLTWDDAVAMAATLTVGIRLVRARHDAVLVDGPQGRRIVIDQRLNPESWGIFCVVHELAHSLLHPGSRDFYLGSPGWFDRTESQANVIALLALWPFRDRRPYPRILRIRPEGPLVTFDVHYVSEHLSADFGPRWMSRRVTLQRYR